MAKGVYAAHRHDRPRQAARTLIFGIHAVEAALSNPRRPVRKLWLTDNAARRLQQCLQGRSVTWERVTPKDLDRRLGPETVHQGALLDTAPLPEPALADLVRDSAGRPLVVLDQVTDPHNVGAVLRSAAVFDAAGLIMTRRHSPPLEGALAKSASGALELVPVCLVQNLARALAELRQRAVVIVGLDGEAPISLEDIDWPERVALVLGAEGKGLRHLTRQSCDRLCRISGGGPLTSLNVSNAAAVVLHFCALWRRGFPHRRA
jgi:23S rRNA (guanosine2251-2'-O)-methyltransferase